MKKRYLILMLTVTILSLGCVGQKKDNETLNKKKESTMNVITLTKSEFLNNVVNYETTPNEWKYLGDKPCIVDFYASWCGPCKQLAPVLEELAKEYDGKVYIYKVDTEKEQDLSAVFGIQSIPTLLLCPMTGAPQIVQGALPKAKLEEAIEEVLLKK